MNGNHRKDTALESDLEVLRRQLQEATDTLEAIRRGEVDALVLPCPCLPWSQPRTRPGRPRSPVSTRGPSAATSWWSMTIRAW
jgi:hypothetical protein